MRRRDFGAVSLLYHRHTVWHPVDRVLAMAPAIMENKLATLSLETFEKYSGLFLGRRMFSLVKRRKITGGLSEAVLSVGVEPAPNRERSEHVLRPCKFAQCVI